MATRQSKYSFSSGGLSYLQPLNTSISFDLMLKILPTRGNLVYEYNPFRNYRLDKDMFEYKEHFYTLEELAALGIRPSGNTWTGLPDQSQPTLYESGCLVDFETEQLQFDINHPVEMLPQYSYDGSVNLVLNNGKDIPRLINSRFTSLGKNTYEIIDRKGDNDVNIYDRGKQFDIDTSLYKRVVEIPELEFIGAFSGGNIKVGNYVYYFKYADDDGNETDFVAESGVVSMFIGFDIHSIIGGTQDQNTYKMVRFILSNIDPGYSYVNIYYTRTTSDVSGEPIKSAHRIDRKFEVSKSLTCQISITGFDPVVDIPIDEINIQYCIASSVYTQASAQNRLFLANIHRPDIPYKELADLSLRICPTVGVKDYETVDFEYTNDVKNTYYDPNFIYHYTGYANNGEMYCLAAVYILPDNTLSPAFPIRGGVNISDVSNDSALRGMFSEIPIYQTKNGKRVRTYISSDENTGEFISVAGDADTPGYPVNYPDRVENSWGIMSIQYPTNNSYRNDTNTIYHINMRIHDSVKADFFAELASIGIKGFFFVRQKRIPFTICQALTIGMDKNSHTPVLPVDSKILKDAQIDNVKDDVSYITERFMNNDRVLSNEFLERVYVLDKNSVSNTAAICPEFDCYPGYYNQVFNGSKFFLTEANFKPSGDRLTMNPSDNRHVHVLADTNNNYNDGSTSPTNVIVVNDNAPIVSMNNDLWRGRAGEAEEAFRFEYIERDNKVRAAANLVRGVYGNYLGLNGIDRQCSIVNIKTSEAANASVYDKMQVRHADKSPYYAISKRYSMSSFYYSDETTLLSNAIIDSLLSGIYRGDSFICTFTHRFNRNFMDPEAPNNDKIVDPKTWSSGYNFDENDFSNINRGDVNAVKMGMWITFPVVSYRNLNIRSLDPSYPEEEGLTGHKRGFYPYYGMAPEGSYKIPESMVLNAGLSANLGERWNMPVPDVPYIKNQFQTRILYSDVHVNDAFKNGFRVFQATHFRDYPRTYGAIVRLIEISGSLLCVYEHGVVLIPVNERVQSGSGDGGEIFITTDNVLPINPRVISESYGTQWAESVIKTPHGIYGVDTVAKKIWRTDGQTFELISDFKIQEFLNLNISLSERETTPIIGIRNVKAHYNAFKKDVMFTFYDNTVGFEEKVWNICFNEILDEWMTFYSWLPSYSASIDNIYFSFDRNTSKWISKLGISRAGNSFAHGIVLTENIISRGSSAIGSLSLVGIELPDLKTGVNHTFTFTLERDNFGYYKMFEIRGNTLYLKSGVSYDSLLANIFVMDATTGRRVFMDRNDPNYKDTIVYQLNIRCVVNLLYTGNDNNIKQYVNGWNEYKTMGMGYYDYSVAVMPKDNMKYLTTDFWKHGQAGIIDIADKIVHTQWYGRMHPFEVEVVVVDDSSVHKIYENLQIIGNMAEPESFHFEITGDYYEWEDDKLNVYFRQEAVKALYQYNGSDILFNRDFTEIIPRQRIEVDYNDKSTMFPLYYVRQDRFDYVEDYYKGVTAPNKDYSYLSGTEIVHYDTLGEYRMWTHIKGNALNKVGRTRGNMWYQEDKWFVQIPSVNFVQKNEATWRKGTKQFVDIGGVKNYVSLPPLPVLNSPVPNDIINTNITDNDFPEELKEFGYDTRDIDVSDWSGNYTADADLRKEARIRDKYCKVRIRYTGDKPVVIQAIRTIYSDSNW